MQIRFLGTGTSTGVPQLRCKCRTCTSHDPCDKRMRASAIVTLDNGSNLLIDCGPDFRTQMLSCGEPPLEAVLLTHSHYDHVGGIDDLRPYCSAQGFPVYCSDDVADDLRNRVPYCFKEHPYPGVPHFDIRLMSHLRPVTICSDKVTPVTVMHYKLPIFAYRIGQLGYITDCKTISDESVEAFRGVDTLVVNALRPEEHLSHMNLAQALALIERISPRQAILTHIAHQMPPHAEAQQMLPQGVLLAYDGLTVEIPSR